ncbi:MAG: hypothetical protein HW399_1086 [Dehalococcoidia bacterium]|nr:hypothetical protein [Dehalococcoidia bacterium]
MNGIWRIIHAWLRRDKELPSHFYKPNPQPLPESGRGLPPLRVGEGDRGRGYFQGNPSSRQVGTMKDENGFRRMKMAFSVMLERSEGSQGGASQP